MAKKINLNGKCFALTKLWANQFQQYGKFNFLFKKYILFSYLFKEIISKKFAFNNFFSLMQIKTFIYSHTILIKLFISNFNTFKQISWIYLLWNQNLQKLTFSLVIFLNKKLYFSKEFLEAYLCYLSSNEFNSPKRIFNLINLLLSNHLNKIFVMLTKNGIKNQKFIGFKLQLRGRFEPTKNAMAKCVTLKSGKINSTNLKIKIDFSNYFFYTKLGTSNLKIWLFYS
uniref:Ribosomal protein S3 n=1 Tax=Dipterosiphonia australica TaxID=2007208 RepID=UPI0022FDA49F|nr:Ribosomal protein S3 [Dipterosiphonia australica]WAX04225.1 Ribosomal protein S3 [Dipterosiphonia australica]